MKNDTERRFYIKITIALVLTALIVFGLLYLLLTNAADRIRHHGDASPTPDVTASPLPTETPTAEPTGTPEDTGSPEPTADITAEPSPTADVSPTPEITPSSEPSAEPTETPDETPTPTPEITPTPTPEITPTPTPEITATPTPEITPTPTPEVTPGPTPSGEADPVSDASLTKVANRNHLIDPNYVPADLMVPNVKMNNTQQLRREAGEALEKMFAAAKKAGYKLKLVSGYRTYSRQKILWNTYVTRYGTKEASRIDSYPGASEHMLGLAVDLGTTDDKCRLEACFANTKAYQWLVKHCSEYGYILRYPKNKEDVTGLKFHPWGYRYVGVEEAKKIMASGLTMEEYYGMQ